MHPLSRLGLVVALCAAGVCAASPALLAQQPKPAPAAPAPAPAPTPTAAQAADPSALHVTGLTSLNQGPVQIALETIGHRVWHCIDCDVTRSENTPCPSCKGTMNPAELTSLRDVVVDPAAGTIHFALIEGQQVLLSEIEKAVARYKLVIPPERQFIPQVSTLRVSGPTSKEAMDALLAGLKTSGLFEKLAGKFDPDTQQAELTVKCVGSPPRPKLEEALTAAAPGSRLVDIVWTVSSSGGPPRGG